MTLRFRLTYILILINLAIYLCTSIISGDFIFTDDTLLMQLGQWNYMVLSGHYWQLLTAMFIHVNLIHLTVNLFFLLIFGLRAEQLFTMLEYIFIYFLSGLAGNLSTLLLGPYTVSAGASGAIFGLFGACIIYIRRTIGQSIVSALLYGFILLMLSNAPGVNFLAHLGGLAAGLTIGYVVASRRSFQITYQYAISYG